MIEAKKLAEQLDQQLKAFKEAENSQKALDVNELIALFQTATSIFKPHRVTLFIRTFLRKFSSKFGKDLKDKMPKAIDQQKKTFLKSLKKELQSKNAEFTTTQLTKSFNERFKIDESTLLADSVELMKEYASTFLRNRAQVLAGYYDQKPLEEFLKGSGINHKIFDDKNLVDILSTDTKTTAEITKNVQIFLTELKELANILTTAINILKSDMIQQNVVPNPDSYEPKLSDELEQTLEPLFYIAVTLCGKLKKEDQLGTVLFYKATYQLVGLHANFKQYTCGNNPKPKELTVNPLSTHKKNGWNAVKGASKGESLYQYYMHVIGVLMQFRNHEITVAFCKIPRAKFYEMCQEEAKNTAGILASHKELLAKLAKQPKSKKASPSSNNTKLLPSSGMQLTASQSAGIAGTGSNSAGYSSQTEHKGERDKGTPGMQSDAGAYDRKDIKDGSSTKQTPVTATDSSKESQQLNKDFLLGSLLSSSSLSSASLKDLGFSALQLMELSRPIPLGTVPSQSWPPSNLNDGAIATVSATARFPAMGQPFQQQQFQQQQQQQQQQPKLMTTAFNGSVQSASNQSLAALSTTTQNSASAQSSAFISSSSSASQATQQATQATQISSSASSTTSTATLAR